MGVITGYGAKMPDIGAYCAKKANGLKGIIFVPNLFTMKIIVNSAKLAEYLNGFLLHAKIGDTYDFVIHAGELAIRPHIIASGVKVRPISVEDSQRWEYEQIARLAIIVGVVTNQDVVFNLETLSICVIL